MIRSADPHPWLGPDLPDRAPQGWKHRAKQERKARLFARRLLIQERHERMLDRDPELPGKIIDRRIARAVQFVQQSGQALEVRVHPDFLEYAECVAQVECDAAGVDVALVRVEVGR